MYDVDLHYIKQSATIYYFNINSSFFMRHNIYLHIFQITNVFLNVQV